MTDIDATVPAPLRLSAAVLDRAVGAVVGSAAGDALGAHYEFDVTPGPGQARMLGGGLGNFAPGEWTDDTSQAVPILTALADGLDLNTPAGRDAVARGWLRWWDDRPADVGVHTAALLRTLGRQGATAGIDNPAATLEAASAAAHARTGHAAGNGALMRTGPVALGYLDDRDGCAAAARRIAGLTHADPVAGDACVLWSEAIRIAIGTGGYAGLRGALDLIPAERRAFWAGKLDDAEAGRPGTFGGNGFCVVTLQDAWSAITRTDSDGARSFAAAVDAAVNAGNDTDTVAAVAGALAGARWGGSAVPARWRALLHGWPGMTSADLAAAAVRAALGGRDDAQGWPSTTSMLDGYARDWGVRPAAAVPHPDDDGLLLGTTGTLRQLAAGGLLAGQVDDVVSLCRLGTADVPDGIRRHDVWLIDVPDESANPNLDFVVADTVELIAHLRGEGRRVLLQCVAAESRTPTIAAVYGARVAGGTPLEALERVQEVVPHAYPKRPFHALLTRLSAGRSDDEPSRW